MADVGCAMVGDEWDDEWESASDLDIAQWYPQPEIRLRAAKCPTCIFRPGNPMDLRDGRLASLIASVRASRSQIVCHDTLPPNGPGSICRGYADAYGGDCNALAIAEQFGCLKLT